MLVEGGQRYMYLERLMLVEGGQVDACRGRATVHVPGGVAGGGGASISESYADGAAPAFGSSGGESRRKQGGSKRCSVHSTPCLYRTDRHYAPESSTYW